MHTHSSPNWPPHRALLRRTVSETGEGSKGADGAAPANGVPPLPAGAVGGANGAAPAATGGADGAVHAAAAASAVGAPTLSTCNQAVYHCLGALSVLAVDPQARAAALQVRHWPVDGMGARLAQLASPAKPHTAHPLPL